MGERQDPPPASGQIEELVDARIDAKLSQYRRVFYAFLGGLGLLVVLVVGSGLISEQSLIVLLHDEIFGLDDNLVRSLSGSVAVSYNNQFWLGTQEGLDRSAILTFYADEAQEAEALLNVTHYGTGHQHRLAVTLDAIPVLATTEDLSFFKVDLAQVMRDHRHFIGGPDNLHNLQFGIEAGDAGESDDRVFIGVVINVFGTERRSGNQ